MAAKLRTKYKIRAALPAKLLELTELKEKARELGWRVFVDESGNAEGVWESSLLNLDSAVNSLRRLGLRDFLIQSSLISFTVAVKNPLLPKVAQVIRADLGRDAASTVDVFSGDTVLRFDAPCEAANQLADALHDLGVSNLIGVESYAIENEKAN
jgi:hypothetical protein